MNINSIPQRRRGTGSSVILSPQMSMQVNKQMHGTRISGARNNVEGRTRRDGGGKTGAQWCLKGILRTEYSGSLQKIRSSKIYWQKTAHRSDRFIGQFVPSCPRISVGDYYFVPRYFRPGKKKKGAIVSFIPFRFIIYHATNRNYEETKHKFSFTSFNIFFFATYKSHGTKKCCERKTSRDC